ncbi:MAG: radical SAM protein [Suipraeoptans sp.]
MKYEGAVYRPPSEARSLIIQITIGCARNTCTFCSMYKVKRFRVRPREEVVEDLISAREYYRNVQIKKVFLADGDALIVKTEDLIYILKKIKEIFPEVERISAYGAPADVIAKSQSELESLRQSGLRMIYIGGESGDNKVLTDVKKGVTAEQIIIAGKKLKSSGMITSITFISGLGGRDRLKEHALGTARVISEINPEYVGLLTLMLEKGTVLYEQEKRREFELLKPMEIMTELKLLVENIDSSGTVFRSNHASNYFALKGTFNEDREAMLREIQNAIKSDDYTPEGYRSL